MINVPIVLTNGIGDKMNTYVAWDNTKFTNKKKYDKYMVMLKRINKALALLKPVPKEKQEDFNNHLYFVQQEPEVMKKVRNVFFKYFNPLVKEIEYGREFKEWHCHVTCCGWRLFRYNKGKHNIQCLHEFYIRLYYIDDKDKEWAWDKLGHYRRDGAIQRRLMAIEKANQKKEKL